MIINLQKGWSVIEDVHEFGEKFNIHQASFDSTRFGGEPDMQPMAPWKPIERLEHLQLTFAPNPYYGFGLRQFNYSPWWYRNEFMTDGDTENAVLSFKGVDYFAEVWLNEQYLGSHEGYNTPFSFEVGKLIKKNEKNLLIVKVSAPWENNIKEGQEYLRFLFVIRDQMKGTYEHSDTFIPRDVNPIGIWDEVIIELYSGIRLEQNPDVDYVLNSDYSKADVCLKYAVRNNLGFRKAKVEMIITKYAETEVAAKLEETIELQEGINPIERFLTVHHPDLWTIWERGEAHRYTVLLKIFSGDVTLLQDKQTFGIRKIELVRTPDEVCFFLNGKKLYLRGTTYFPDAYISAMNKPKYIRDLDNAKNAGMNALRIHVHSEKNEFYDLCDERGILLIQDSDFNWMHPENMEWGKRALKMFEELIHRLKNHPSIFCWVCLNEPRSESYLTVCPGPQMVELIREIDPNRPYIKSSWDIKDPESGDSHNYEGSLHGAHTHYANIYGSTEKLNTEFGMDAPPCYESLRMEPELCKILGKVVDGIDSIQYYQYRMIKYFIEHYRMQKYAPCSGHFQFLFTDAAPTSLFGVYDRYGIPKYAQRAFIESNQPIGILMETQKNKPEAIWAVNDLLQDYMGATASWQITAEDGSVIQKDLKTIDLTSDSAICVTPIEFNPVQGIAYTVLLVLRDADGKLLAKNTYEKAFNPPDHTPGHPSFVHHGIGLRTYWTWMKQENI